ncbi:GRAE protein, partial [Columbina picui]|nr:GRAE protein [Columbina picui]
YVAYLRGRDGHSCGGFLVAPNWVMTAAQCSLHQPLTVILGARRIQRREESWQTFEVEKYYCYKDFKSPQNGDDILLLKLKGNATSNSYVSSISLEKSTVPGGTVCSTAIWGYKPPADELHEATVTIIKERECLTRYPGLIDNVICGQSASAKVPEHVTGNAGDPLVCNNKAYGIFSYNYKQLGFYTDITRYLPWINNIMK